MKRQLLSKEKGAVFVYKIGSCVLYFKIEVIKCVICDGRKADEENMKSVILPKTNQSGYYEIRLESIGGLGANLCGKMLGELGIRYLGLNSASFSSYGSEKTGTPVKGYIRYCDAQKEIRVHAPVVEPHLLCIFHEALLQDGVVLDGCTAETTVVLNTEKTPQEVVDCYFSNTEKCVKAAAVYTIPAQKIAIEAHARVNVVMLGAMVAACGFGSLEDVQQICKDNLGKKYPDSLAANLEGIQRGYEELKGITLEPSTKTEACSRSREKQSQWGYETAPIGGINPHLGSSVVADLSASRQGYIPIFKPEKCINCALCDSTCPDMVFQFEKGVYKDREMMVNKGLDYYHCKGCLRCVDVCPTGALVRGVEAECEQKEHFLPNKDLLRKPDYYEKSGADGYITSESYLTEERVEGGEV